MSDILEGLWHAIRLLIQRDAELLDIIWLSLKVTGVGLVFSNLIGIPTGVFMGLRRFRGRRFIMALLYTGMGFPPVVIGLFVYLLLSRSGPLGVLGWLLTPKAMVIAQTIIAFPIVAGFTMVAVTAVDPQLRMQLMSLGATSRQATWSLLKEARLGVVVAVIAAFGSIISEVGSVMLVGGNIAGKTRVLTTAIVLETRKGAFGFAIALGIVLLGIVFLANVAMMRLQGQERKSR